MQKKIIAFYERNKGAVLGGLATTAIWEIGKALLKGLPDAGYELLRYLGNLPYFMASSPIEDLWLTLIVGSVIWLGLAAALSMLVRAIDLFVRARMIGREKNKLDKEEMPPKDASVQTQEERLEMIKKDTSRILLKAISKAILLSVICIFLFLVMIQPQSLRMAFETHIDIIAPYTDDYTIKKLKSDWARMKTKEDYLAIDSVFSEIIDSNNLRDNK